MRCYGCGSKIHPLRLKVLPNTTKCVNCSNVGKKKGFMVYSNKTGGQIEIVNSEQYDELYRLSKRNGTVTNAMWESKR